MNDDLISRKSLIENLNKFALEHYNTLVNDLIMKEPIAFNKAKVIDELKECKKIMLSPVNIDCFGEECKENDCTACAFRKAIEIVEKGGIE